ncbi:unnamed protein product [Protopolystoma xenopodis]|uniref:Uncharacterized protein n=1 Tax=Protopolystoma xenopodis TaxID=117903 RepID=A0A448WMQ4_9PLAT|nr:unnamed protein product [Protopolystoma xenopodis]
MPPCCLRYGFKASPKVVHCLRLGDEMYTLANVLPTCSILLLADYSSHTPGRLNMAHFHTAVLWAAVFQPGPNLPEVFTTFPPEKLDATSSRNEPIW